MADQKGEKPKDDGVVSPTTETVDDNQVANEEGPGKVKIERIIPNLMKVMLVGPAKAGKSSLIQAFRRKPLKKKYKRSTYFKCHRGTWVQVFDKTVNLEIWDTGLQGLANIALMRVDAIIVCYDITDPDEAEKIVGSEWLQLLKKGNAYTPIILCGCKNDNSLASIMAQKKKTSAAADDSLPPVSASYGIVTSSKAHTIKDALGAQTLIETSAVNGLGVRTVFEKAILAALANPNFDYDEMDPYGTDPLEAEKEKLKASSWAQTVLNTFKMHGDKPFLGVRNADKDGVIPPKYQWTTYSTVERRIRHFGAGLRQLLPARSYVCVCAVNSVEWVVSDLSAQLNNLITVIVHWTFPSEDTEFIVKQADLSCAMCSSGILPQFAYAASKHNSLKYVIKIDGDCVTAEEQEKYGQHCKLLHISEVEKLGEAHPRDIEVPNDDDLYTVEYTSGSTGKPKGIMLKTKAYLEDTAVVGLSHACVLFEPLSHSERTNSYRRMLGGAKLGIFNRGMGVELFEEFQIIRPTIIVAVPRLWNVIYTEYQKLLAIYRTTVPKMDPVKVEKQVRAYFYNLMGGRILMMATGGAPTSRAVYSWMFGFDCYVAESYGIMEVGGIASSKSIKSDIEWRLEDVPEMGYTKQDQPFPRGELVVKSSTMSAGYFKNEDETSKAFVDGWFRTGDIVQVEKPGSVRVIDRKKDIFKLAQGEYISPVKCEAVFQQSKFIEQIYVHGDSLQNYLIAVVVPNEGVTKQWAVENGLSPSLTFAQLCQEKFVNQALLDDLNAAALLHKLRAYEHVRKLLLVADRFTVDNGQLTATNKLNRRAIARHYKPALDALYKAGPPGGAGVSLTGGRAALTSSTGAKLHQVVEKLVPGSGALAAASSGATSLVELGMDSLSAINLVSQIQKEFQVAVPVDALYKPDMDVDKLATLLEHQKGKEAWLLDESVWETHDEEAYLKDLDIYAFLPDLIPKEPTAPSLASLLGSHTLAAIVVLEDPSKPADITETAAATTEQKAEASSTSDEPRKLETQVQTEPKPTQAEEKKVESKDKPADAKEPTKPADAASGAATSTSEGASGEKPVEGAAKAEEPKGPIKDPPAREAKDYSFVQQILLTGVSGYLGVYLLVESLAAYRIATVHCLIRAKSQEAAEARLEAQLDKYEIKLSDYDRKRVVLVVGDLAKPKLGIEEELYAQLLDKIEAIYHCGAWVNGILPYSALRPANVLGTVELIRFALTGKLNRKTFHYVSTISTLSTAASPNKFLTESVIDSKKSDFFRDMGGYPLTKLVSEILLIEAADKIRDFVVVIYRPGTISGHSKTGAANLEAYVNKLLVGMIQLGYAPRASNPHLGMDWAPVDYVARTIVSIAKGGPIYSVYHMSNPMALYSITMQRLTTAIRSFGYKVEDVSFNKWRRKLDKFMATNTNALAPLRSYFDRGFPGDSLHSIDHTQDAIKGSVANKCPLIDEPLIHSYLRYWIRRGVLTAPAEAPQATTATGEGTTSDPNQFVAIE